MEVEFCLLLFAGNGKLAQERRRKVVSDVASIFMHKIGTVISYSIDNVVLSGGYTALQLFIL